MEDESELDRCRDIIESNKNPIAVDEARNIIRGIETRQKQQIRKRIRAINLAEQADQIKRNLDKGFTAGGRITAKTTR